MPLEKEKPTARSSTFIFCHHKKPTQKNKRACPSPPLPKNNLELDAKFAN